jgi:hypothetical protein
MRTPITKKTRQALAEMRARRKQRQEARNAELDRQDREAAERLHNLKPAPLFSTVAVDGACPKCGGRQFRSDERFYTGVAEFLTLLLAGSIGAQVDPDEFLERIKCVTCGELFRR